MNDTYLSIHRSTEHSCYSNNINIKIIYIDCEDFECISYDDEIEKKLNGINGVVIPGGFGIRGIEGMINVASYCRRNNIPTIGICLGMQIMCIEAARRE